jgi:hypothetical protein
LPAFVSKEIEGTYYYSVTRPKFPKLTLDFVSVSKALITDTKEKRIPTSVVFPYAVKFPSGGEFHYIKIFLNATPGQEFSPKELNMTDWVTPWEYKTKKPVDVPLLN